MGRSRRSRKQHDHEEHMDETWLIPYSDLMTLLLALFIILFASSQIDQKRFLAFMAAFNQALTGGVGVMDQPVPIPPNDPSITQETAKPEIYKPAQESVKRRNLIVLKSQIDKYIIENQLSAKVTTLLEKEELMIVIRDHALFDSGSAVVKPDSKKLGIALSEMLAHYPQFEVIVAGHTDNQPIRNSQYESNWDLSTERALNFMKVILSNKKLSPAKFRAVGFGEYRPIASNETEAGRARNRRVEVSIF